MLIFVFATIGLLYISFVLYQKWGRPARFPKGPPILPFVGSIPFLVTTPSPIAFKNWRSKYGDIIGLKLGPVNLVVLHNLDHIKEAFNDNVFVSVNVPRIYEEMITDGKVGVVHFGGKEWLEQRKFAVKNLRDLGTRKQTHESMVQEDIQDLLEILKNKSGQPVVPVNLLSSSILNSLWHVLAGKRFELTDPKFQEFAEKMMRPLEVASRGVIPVFLPWFSKVFPNLSGLNQLRKAYSDVFEIIQESIDEHKRTYEKEHLRDYMDTYLHEIESANDPNSSFYKETGYANMLFWSLLLFIGGIETTTATLAWAIFLLAKNPKVQKKLQEEIDTVVGPGRLPSLSHRPTMPYTEAVILEIFRVSSVAPFGIPHETSENIEFHGYKIPKKTIFLPYLYALHHDQKIWGDPENFRPERFMEANGKELKKVHHSLIPFSVGKKSCPGETYARNNVFLFITSIFQRFSVTGHLDPKFENEYFFLLRHPPQGKYIFQERQQA